MYEALYRKWRPLRFADVVGQGHITETLKNEIVTGRVSHAYLFTGTRGTGKTSCAKILARAVNCQSPNNGDPCNQCPACLGLLDGSIMDVVEIDAASYSGVDNIRALRDESIYAPTVVNKRVYIIDEVHMLSTGAFNALLTILEEPPPHLLFVLVTTETHKILPTILSRCQRFNFRRIAPVDMKRHVVDVAAREGFALDDQAARLIVRLADGSLRDALSLLDQCMAPGQKGITLSSAQEVLGMAGDQSMFTLVAAITDRDASAALSCFSELYAAGRDPISLLDELTSLLRDVLLFHLLPDRDDTSHRDGIESLAAGLGTERLTYAIALLQELLTGLRSSGRRLDAEVALLRLCDERLGYDLNALIERVAALEEASASGQVLERQPGRAFAPPMNNARETPLRRAEPSEPISTPPVPDRPVTAAEATPSPSIEEPSQSQLNPVIEPTVPPPPVNKNAEAATTGVLPADFADKLNAACAPKLLPITAGILKSAHLSLSGAHLSIGVEAYESSHLKKSEAIIRAEASALLGHEIQLLFVDPPAQTEVKADPLDSLIELSGVSITVEE